MDPWSLPVRQRNIFRDGGWESRGTALHRRAQALLSPGAAAPGSPRLHGQCHQPCPSPPLGSPAIPSPFAMAFHPFAAHLPRATVLLTSDSHEHEFHGHGQDTLVVSTHPSTFRFYPFTASTLLQTPLGMSWGYVSAAGTWLWRAATWPRNGKAKHSGPPQPGIWQSWLSI